MQLGRYRRSTAEGSMLALLQDFRADAGNSKSSIKDWGGLDRHILTRIMQKIQDSALRCYTRRCSRLVNSHWCSVMNRRTTCLQPIPGNNILVQDVIEAAISHFPHVTKVDFSGCSLELGVPPTISCLGVLPNLGSLSLRGKEYDASLIAKISGITNLTHLSVTSTAITGNILTAFRNLMALRHLDISDNKEIADDGMDQLSCFLGLRQLDLNRCDKLTNMGLKHISNLIWLEHLSIRGVWHLSDKGLSFISCLTLLTCLEMSDHQRRGIWGITDVAIDHLLTMSSLRRMYLPPSISGDGLSPLTALQQLTHLEWCLEDSMDSDLVALESFPSLVSLSLLNASLSFSKRNLKDKGLRLIAGLTNLTALDIRAAHWITSAGLLCLSSLSRLTTLRITHCHRVKGSGFGFLKSTRKLRLLDLTGCYQLSDEALGNMSGLIHLRRLYLDCCNKITDEGLKSLAAVPSLTQLTLGGGVTDEGLGVLRHLPNLDHVGIAWSTRITDKGISKLLEGASRLSRLSIFQCDYVQLQDLPYKRSQFSEFPRLLKIDFSPLEDDDKLAPLAKSLPFAIINRDDRWLFRKSLVAPPSDKLAPSEGHLVACTTGSRRI
ncbi:hypothetical protein BSKO_06561 [Bryopsis sp. KO-2023]|nr:hypothetical protein BSKO_06561 [Bryopsis sp. KO-2023]